MFIEIIIILLMIISYILFLFILNKKSSYQLFKNLPVTKKLLSDAYDTLKTGDIIYFRCLISEIDYELFLSMFNFKHAGLIVRIDNILYITESNTGREYYKDGEKIYSISNGISLTPLFTRLMHDQSLFFISSLENPLTIEQEKKIISFVDDAIINYKYPSRSLIMAAIFLNIKLRKTYYCFIYVYEILSFVNIIPRNKNTHVELSYYMDDIYKYTLNNNKYNYPYKLVYDI